MKMRPEKLLTDPIHPERKFYMTVIPIADVKVEEKYLVRPLDQKHKNNLKEQIQEEGLIEPITVHEEQDGSFLLLAGQHRIVAVKELEQSEVPAKIYVNLNETAKRLIGYMSNELRKRPPAGKRYEALNEIFDETKRELQAEGKTPSEEQVVNQLYFKSSTIRVKEMILGITVDRLRNDTDSLVLKYGLIQDSQVHRKKMEEAVRNGSYPLLTAQNTFTALSNLCRAKPITQTEEEEGKNYREHEYKNVREYFDRIITEFIEPWIEVGAIDTAINFCRIHPFEAFTKIVHDFLVDDGHPSAGTKSAPFYHDIKIDWDGLLKRLSPLKDSKIWNVPVIAQERNKGDLKARLRYIIQNNGKFPDF